MDLIATLSCQDQPGIVHAMTKAILDCSGNIIENQQFTDPITNFLLCALGLKQMNLLIQQKSIQALTSKFSPKISIRESAKPKNVLVLVSKESHCLRDLLYLKELGELSIQIPLVISNHTNLAKLVESHGIKFKSISNSNENEISESVKDLDIDLMVLARYMQVLSPQLCEQMSGQIINIHHSFLPGFKGAKPYHQAYERGVKVIELPPTLSQKI